MCRGKPATGAPIVSAVIYNPGPQNAELLRAFVTLLDNLGRVIGYRVVTFDAGTILEAGAQMPLEIEVTPQISDGRRITALRRSARHRKLRIVA